MDSEIGLSSLHPWTSGNEAGTLSVPGNYLMPRIFTSQGSHLVKQGSGDLTSELFLELNEGNLDVKKKYR